MALALHGLFKTYGATQALVVVDLAIARGQVVALMGANGAGKSTLANIASGVVLPDRGGIVVAGRGCASLRRRRRARRASSSFISRPISSAFPA